MLIAKATMLNMRHAFHARIQPLQRERRREMKSEREKHYVLFVVTTCALYVMPDHLHASLSIRNRIFLVYSLTSCTTFLLIFSHAALNFHLHRTHVSDE